MKPYATPIQEIRLPKILFITCTPLEKPRNGAMGFMSVLLDEYADTFAWFSLRAPEPDSVNSYKIPFEYVKNFKHPARFPHLKQFISLLPWAKLAGYKAAIFGRSQNVQIVLADLAFEAVVAGRVAAKALGVPLLVSVHDDPVNRVRVKGYPNWLVKWYEYEFSKTMHSALRCGVISDYMGEIYRERYGVKTTTLYIGVEEKNCLPQKKIDFQKVPIVIGSVGSVNSAENWKLLLEAVRVLNQLFGVGKFQILHLGKLADGFAITDDVEVTGWVPDEEVKQYLKRMDIGFLNWSFAPEMTFTRRTSFPLKITSYIQAQIPMLALGPTDSTAYRFVQDNKCGVTCSEAKVDALSERLQAFLFNGTEYSEAMIGVGKLMETFSREKYFKNFNSFILGDSSLK